MSLIVLSISISIAVAVAFEAEEFEQKEPKSWVAAGNWVLGTGNSELGAGYWILDISLPPPIFPIPISISIPLLIPLRFRLFPIGISVSLCYG